MSAHPTCPWTCKRRAVRSAVRSCTDAAASHQTSCTRPSAQCNRAGLLTTSDSDPKLQPRAQTLPPETESTRLQSLHLDLRAFDAPWPVVMGVCLNGLAGIVTAGPSAPDEEPSQLHGTPTSLNGKSKKRPTIPSRTARPAPPHCTYWPRAIPPLLRPATCNAHPAVG